MAAVRILDTNIDSKELHLRSDDVKFEFSTSDYLFKTTLPLTCPSHLDWYLSVKNAEFPISFYNTTTKNNLLKLEYDGTIHNIYIPVGNRSLIDIITYLDTQLKVLNLSITLDWEAPVNKVIFKSLVKEFKIMKESTALRMFGFTEKEHTNKVGDNINISLESDSLCDTRSVTTIHIHSDFQSLVSVFSFHDNKFNNVIARIPVEGALYDTILYKPNNPHQVPIRKKTLTQFRIKITDHSGNVIDFNNMIWSMCFEIHYYQKRAANTAPVIANAVPYSSNAYGMSNTMNQVMSELPYLGVGIRKPIKLKNNYTKRTI
jgi:hypothetical protein